MRLLFATDHRFFKAPDGNIYDDAWADYAFFEDYLSVFEDLVVAARVSSRGVPAGARRADGDRVSFIELPDIHGPRWALSPKWLIMRTLSDAVRDCDAVCGRLPSTAAYRASLLAQQMSKPFMFELAGDPVRNLDVPGARFPVRLAAALEGARVKGAVRRSVCGSYVSKRHLQHRYPAPEGTKTDAISSIRLATASVHPARIYESHPHPLRVVLTAVFFPVKRHTDLLDAVALTAGEGIPIHLHLVGDGPLRQASIERAARLGITDLVTFHGYVSDRDRLLGILRESDVFAMTSASEGLPRAMLEGMAQGIAAVGTDVGGIAELLPKEQLFLPGDVSALAGMFRRLQSDLPFLNDSARRSHEVASEYVSERLSARRIRLYQELREHVHVPVGTKRIDASEERDG